jgi:hypothetical protein
MIDKHLKQIVTAFRNGILNGRASRGMCFAVSWPLQGYLSAIGVETEIVEGEVDPYPTNHFWLALNDGRIIDATANQFNEPLMPSKRRMPKVYIGELPLWYAPCTDPADGERK